jgi:alkylation response protein AidB-like acyl-CoA dehydrogenase
VTLVRPRAGRGEDLLAAAHAVASEIAATAEDIERERRLPERLVQRLYAAGLFTMLVPRALGGSELELPSYVEIVEELARTDASVGWCVGQASGLSALSAYMNPRLAAEVFLDSGRRAIFANGPGEGNRPGRAVVVGEGDGYRLSGRWNFASGSRHASWLLAICNLYEPDERAVRDADGTLAERLMVLPVEQAELLDVWQVSGLRGTGSFSFTVSDLFVPLHRCIHVCPAERREPGPLYQFSNSGIFGPSFGSVSLGIAHAALAAFVAMAGGKTPRGLPNPLSQSATVQASVARAHARLGAARAFLHTTLTDVWSRLTATGVLETADRVAVRLAATHATQEAKQVVDAAYELAGSTAIFAGKPFERRFRDQHAVTQQLQARAAHYESVGRYLLGLDPDSAFL